MSLLSDWVNPSVLAKRERFHELFSGAFPFPHVQVRSFLREEKIHSLARGLSQVPFEPLESDLFSFAQTPDLADVKQKSVVLFHRLFSSAEFVSFIRQVTGLRVSARIDMFGSLYGSSDYLLPHDDLVSSRKLAFLLYLSQGFSPADGGRLVLYNHSGSVPTSVAKRFVPVWNSLFLFKVSSHSFHEVEEVVSKKSRFAIGGWFH